jgi:transposase InsO family protein
MIELVKESLDRDVGLSVKGMCEVLSLSRATLYRRSGTEALDDDTELRDEIQRIALDMPAYGYRRITKALARQGHQVNHKRVLRLMREDNLLCLRKMKYISTTDSGHGLPVYPNLAADMALSGINQLWVADITYIRLRREFVYLAVVLDAFSRRCIGWNLGRRLDDGLTLGALGGALESRQVEPGLVHHSDRGVQYASGEYTDLLKESGIAISMSRSGNPYDNAKAESFMKTLKYEEVYLWEYDSFDDAKEQIARFIKDAYNIKRLHSALGYLPPAEFEQQLEVASMAATP